MVWWRTRRGLAEAALGSSVFLAPSLILAMQMSGKGFTNSFQVGGTVGMTLIWAVALALIFKFAIVDGLARYTLARGDSIFSGLPYLPGPRNWGVWAVIAVYTIELMSYASMALFCAAVLDELLPGEGLVSVMAIVVVLVVLAMLLWRSLGFLEKIVYFIIGTVVLLMAFALLAAVLDGPSLASPDSLPASTIVEDFMLLVGTGSGLSLLLYSVWVSEKIKKIPEGTSRARSLAGVRTGLVLAFAITGVFSVVIMAVAASAGTGSIYSLPEVSLGSFTLTVPVFILAVAVLMYGIVYVGVDGRARAISRMLRQMGLTKMEKAPLYRVLVVSFVTILLATLVLGEPTGLLVLISSVSSVMFAMVGFSLAYLNARLPPPYRAGRLWTAVTVAGSSVFLAIALVRERTMLEFGLPMLLRLAVVAAALLVLIRYGFLGWAVGNAHRARGAAVLVAVFGAVSVFGTVGGVEYDGAVINFRDLGPMMAGALGGPVVGALAGVVGGAFRYGMGGWTAAACFAATVSAGLVSGILFRRWKGPLSYLKLGFLCLLVEGMHLFLYFPLLTMGHPFGEVLDTLRNVTVPMVVTNLVGLMLFQYMLERWGSGVPAGEAGPADNKEGA